MSSPTLRTFAALLVGSALAAALLAHGLQPSFDGSAASALAAKDLVSASLLDNSTGWRLAKYTLNVQSGASSEVQSFISTNLCNSKTLCASDLGCAENWRVWCEVNAPYHSTEFGGFTSELHWVDAPTLNDLSATRSDGTVTSANDEWVSYFEALNGNLSTFNAFMHNKAQLFVNDLAVWESRLTTAGQATLKRKSTDSEGVALGHLSFAVPKAGRLYELVSALSTSAHPDAYSDWAATECGEASTMTRPLSFYSAREHKTAVDDFESEPAVMLVGLSMTYHDLSTATDTAPAAGADNITTLFAHLRAFTGAHVAIESNSEACTTVGITWPNQVGLKVRYVQNKVAPTGVRTLADYDAYFAEMHAKFARADWYSWDHGLDQHIGLYYDGSYDDCMELASLIRDGLKADGISVGERGEPDAHELYSGYAGPMTWQYQLGRCDGGRSSAPEECACVSTNNLDVYRDTIGNQSATCSQLSENWCLSSA